MNPLHSLPDPFLQTPKQKEEKQLTFPLPSQPQFTFENFIVHPGDALAFRAARAVCESPGSLFNPLYLHGESGGGKTHLLQAIRACVQENRGTAHLLSGRMSHEVFAFLVSLRESSSPAGSFILIDDLPELLGMIEGRSCFYDMVNMAVHRRLQLVCAGGEPVQSMPDLDDHLISRLRWGLIVRISPPDDPSRERILKKLARDWQVNLPPRVASFLVERLPRDIASLSTGLAAVNAHALSRGTRISIPVAREALDLLEAGRERR